MANQGNQLGPRRQGANEGNQPGPHPPIRGRVPRGDGKHMATLWGNEERGLEISECGEATLRRIRKSWETGKSWRSWEEALGEFFKQMENDKAELERLVGSRKGGRRKPRGLRPNRWKGKDGKWKEVHEEVVAICWDFDWEGKDRIRQILEEAKERRRAI